MKKPSLPNVEIHSFQPQNQTQVRALILAGLAEHWGELDPQRNSDLDDIGKTSAGGLFLVASRAGQIIGTGALMPGENGSAQVVRMSVRKELRRRGVGRLILDRLIEEAKKMGICELVLETTADWQEAIAFYRSLGFQETHRTGGDVYFRLEI